MRLANLKRSLPQRGAVLLMALIFLIILSLLGVTAMNGTVIETKLAANYVEKNYSLQITETGLAQLENMLSDATQRDTLTANQSVVANAISLTRPSNVTACVSNIRAEGKGRFSQPRQSDVTHVSSAASIDAVYFEINSLGTAIINGSTCDNTANGKVQTHLRSGVRQLAPKVQ